ncbi:streptomycin resistance protein [Allorhizobium taibaishanense]|uniref:Streptomycin resistance protein n=1 Tax=Allorhizobium taibaishanense TaxID=887144 RepID=A0A1Q8ZZV6_9HYPH|nr:streptomycin resistance protein [Allorhizobium taibaishanense]
MKAPALSPDLAHRWGLSHIRAIADTPSSLVYRALQGDRAVVVKALKPEGSGERPGLGFLRWRDGHGAVRILDQADDVALLEDAGTRLLRSYHGEAGDEAATDIVVEVLERLHAPSSLPMPTDLTPLDVHFAALFELEKTQLDADLADIVPWCADLARALIADQRDIKPLHGDIHHDNIIGGDNGAWLAIDPQGLIGDPAYDVANIFGNPLHARALVLDPERALRLSRRFALVLNRTPRTILSYAAAHAGLSCAWTLKVYLPQVDTGFLSGNAQKQKIGPLTPSGQDNLGERLGFARLARSILLEQFVD